MNRSSTYNIPPVSSPLSFSTTDPGEVSTVKTQLSPTEKGERPPLFDVRIPERTSRGNISPYQRRAQHNALSTTSLRYNSADYNYPVLSKSSSLSHQATVEETPNYPQSLRPKKTYGLGLSALAVQVPSPVERNSGRFIPPEISQLDSRFGNSGKPGPDIFSSAYASNEFDNIDRENKDFDSNSQVLGPISAAEQSFPLSASIMKGEKILTEHNIESAVERTRKALERERAFVSMHYSADRIVEGHIDRQLQGLDEYAAGPRDVTPPRSQNHVEKILAYSPPFQDFKTPKLDYGSPDSDYFTPNSQPTPSRSKLASSLETQFSGRDYLEQQRLELVSERKKLDSERLYNERLQLQREQRDILDHQMNFKKESDAQIAEERRRLAEERRMLEKEIKEREYLLETSPQSGFDVISHVKKTRDRSKLERKRTSVHRGDKSDQQARNDLQESAALQKQIAIEEAKELQRQRLAEEQERKVMKEKAIKEEELKRLFLEKQRIEEERQELNEKLLEDRRRTEEEDFIRQQGLRERQLQNQLEQDLTTKLAKEREEQRLKGLEEKKREELRLLVLEKEKLEKDRLALKEKEMSEKKQREEYDYQRKLAAIQLEHERAIELAKEKERARLKELESEEQRELHRLALKKRELEAERLALREKELQEQRQIEEEELEKLEKLKAAEMDLKKEQELIIKAEKEDEDRRLHEFEEKRKEQLKLIELEKEQLEKERILMKKKNEEHKKQEADRIKLEIEERELALSKEREIVAKKKSEFEERLRQEQEKRRLEKVEKERISEQKKQEEAEKRKEEQEKEHLETVRLLDEERRQLGDQKRALEEAKVREEQKMVERKRVLEEEARKAIEENLMRLDEERQLIIQARKRNEEAIKKQEKKQKQDSDALEQEMRWLEEERRVLAEEKSRRTEKKKYLSEQKWLLEQDRKNMQAEGLAQLEAERKRVREEEMSRIVEEELKRSEEERRRLERKRADESQRLRRAREKLRKIETERPGSILHRDNIVEKAGGLNSTVEPTETAVKVSFDNGLSEVRLKGEETFDQDKWSEPSEIELKEGVETPILLSNAGLAPVEANPILNKADTVIEQTNVVLGKKVEVEIDRSETNSSILEPNSVILDGGAERVCESEGKAFQENVDSIIIENVDESLDILPKYSSLEELHSLSTPKVRPSSLNSFTQHDSSEIVTHIEDAHIVIGDLPIKVVCDTPPPPDSLFKSELKDVSDDFENVDICRSPVKEFVHHTPPPPDSLFEDMVSNVSDDFGHVAKPPLKEVKSDALPDVVNDVSVGIGKQPINEVVSDVPLPDSLLVHQVNVNVPNKNVLSDSLPPDSLLEDVGNDFSDVIEPDRDMVNKVSKESLFVLPVEVPKVEYRDLHISKKNRLQFGDSRFNRYNKLSTDEDIPDIRSLLQSSLSSNHQPSTSSKQSVSKDPGVSTLPSFDSLLASVSQFESVTEKKIIEHRRLRSSSPLRRTNHIPEPGKSHMRSRTTIVKPSPIPDELVRKNVVLPIEVNPVNAQDAATLIISFMRMAVARKRYQQDIRRIILIQKHVRRVVARESFIPLRNVSRLAAIMIQTQFRGYRARSRYYSIIYATVVLQRTCRKWLSTGHRKTLNRRAAMSVLKPVIIGWLVRKTLSSNPYIVSLLKQISDSEKVVDDLQDAGDSMVSFVEGLRNQIRWAKGTLISSMRNLQDFGEIPKSRNPVPPSSPQPRVRERRMSSEPHTPPLESPEKPPSPPDRTHIEHHSPPPKPVLKKVIFDAPKSPDLSDQSPTTNSVDGDAKPFLKRSSKRLPVNNPMPNFKKISGRVKNFRERPLSPPKKPTSRASTPAKPVRKKELDRSNRPWNQATSAPASAIKDLKVESDRVVSEEPKIINSANGSMGKSLKKVDPARRVQREKPAEAQKTLSEDKLDKNAKKPEWKETSTLKAFRAGGKAKKAKIHVIPPKTFPMARERYLAMRKLKEFYHEVFVPDLGRIENNEIIPNPLLFEKNQVSSTD